MILYTRNISLGLRDKGIYTEPTYEDRVRYLTEYGRTLDVSNPGVMAHFTGYARAMVNKQTVAHIIKLITLDNHDRKELYGNE